MLLSADNIMPFIEHQDNLTLSASQPRACVQLLTESDRDGVSKLLDYKCLLSLTSHHSDTFTNVVIKPDRVRVTINHRRNGQLSLF